MDSTGAVRAQSDLADMVELLLDKGVVVNADVVVSIGDTELLGVELRAAIASFETAAEYGLEFPEGTDRERIEAATERAGHPTRRDEETRSLRSRPGGSARPGQEERDEEGSIDDEGGIMEADVDESASGDASTDENANEDTNTDEDDAEDATRIRDRFTEDAGQKTDEDRAETESGGETSDDG